MQWITRARLSEKYNIGWDYIDNMDVDCYNFLIALYEADQKEEQDQIKKINNQSKRR